MADGYEEIMRAELERFSRGKDRLLPNIMLLGAAGCGRSSLVNLVFRKDLVPANDASRRTVDFETYWGREHGMGVNLIDSRGYEMEDDYPDSIRKKMEENHKKAPLEKIHIVWYCFPVTSGKIHNYEIQILKRLYEDEDLRNRVAVVLTKCDQDDENGGTAKIFRQIMAREVGDMLPVFEVSTHPDLMLELEQLITWSANQLDDADMKEAFVSTQRISLEAKRQAASARIGFYAATAALAPIGIGAMLMPGHITMSANIIHIYGMENYVSISKAVIENAVISTIEKAFVKMPLKFSPIVVDPKSDRNWLITSALGFAISEICCDRCKKIARGEFLDIPSVLDAETIQDYMWKYIKEHGKTAGDFLL